MKVFLKKNNVLNDRRGVLLFGMIVIVAILGIMYFKGFTLFSTETRRAREDELDSKLSQIRRALDMAKTNDNFRKDSQLDFLDETTDSRTVQKYVIGALRNKDFSRTNMDSKSVYLRQEFTAPLLEVDKDEKLNVGYRIAVNRVNSSSFEGDNFMKVQKIDKLSNVSQVNQWWFTTSDDSTAVSIISDSDRPPEYDYPGQKDTYGNRGKYGKNVLQMVVK